MGKVDLKYFAELIRFVEEHPDATLQEYQKEKDRLRKKYGDRHCIA